MQRHRFGVATTLPMRKAPSSRCSAGGLQQRSFVQRQRRRWC